MAHGEPSTQPFLMAGMVYPNTQAQFCTAYTSMRPTKWHLSFLPYSTPYLQASSSGKPCKSTSSPGVMKHG